MAYDIGTARGVIEMEYNGRGVTEAEKGMEELDKAGGSVNQQLNRVSRTAGLAGAAIVAGLGFAVNAAADFQKAMSGIQAVSGATQSEMDQLRNKALDLGKQTQFSAGESATAIEELIKAGLSVPDVMNGAADATVALAAAGEVDLPTAATIAANSMNQFGLAAKDLPAVADAIAGAANASAIDVGQFGESLQQVGAVAHLAGVDFDDTATAIAIMGNAGIAGSDAGTSLKTMFQRLQPTTKKQSEEMKRLGLITKDGSNQFYTAEGRTKSLSKVAQVLQNSLKGMSQQQKQAALNTLFGSDAIRGAAILSEAGSKGFDKMAKSMGKVSAADVAKTRMDNLSGSIEQMKGSLETAGIAIGTILIPAITQVVDVATGALNWFLGLNNTWKTSITVIAGVVAAVLLMVAAIIKIVQFAVAAKEAFVVLRAAMATTWVAALGPIALVIAAIAAVIVIVILLWKHSETFRNIVTGAWDAIKGAAQGALNFIKQVPGFFQDMWNAIKDAFSAGINWVKSHWLLLLPIFLGPLGLVIALIVKFHSQIIGVFTSIISAITGIWRGFWGSAFGGMVKAAFNLVVAILNLAWVIIKGIFLLNLQFLIKFVRTAFETMKAAIAAVLGAIRAVVAAVWRAITGIIRLELNGIKKIFTTVWNAIAAVLRAIWGRIGGTVTAGANRVKNAVTVAWNAVKNTTRTVWNALVGIVRTVIGHIVELVNGIKGKVVGAIGDASKWLYDKGKAIIQGLIDGITSMTDKVTGAIHGITSKVSGFLPGSPVAEGPLKVLNRGYAGKQIVKMVIDGLDAMTRPLSKAVDGAFGTAVPSGFANPGAGALPGPTRKGRGKGRGRLRMVHGQLDLAPSGRAFIRGVAEDADDDSDDFGDTVDRMG